MFAAQLSPESFPFVSRVPLKKMSPGTFLRENRSRLEKGVNETHRVHISLLVVNVTVYETIEKSGVTRPR